MDNLKKSCENGYHGTVALLKQRISNQVRKIDKLKGTLTYEMVIGYLLPWVVY